MVQKLIKADLYQIGHCVYCMYLNKEVPSFAGFKSINYFEMHANYFQNAEVLKGQEYYSELLRARSTRKNKWLPSYWYDKYVVLSRSEEKSGFQVIIVLC